MKRIIAPTIMLLLFAATPAFAVEPARSPESSRACPRHGPGFVQLPGTTTCVRIGGSISADAGTGVRRVGRDQIAGFGSSAAVSMDSRTDTQYGPVRSYVRVKAGQGPGPRF